MSEEIINNEQGTNNEVQNPETNPIPSQEQENTEQIEIKNDSIPAEEKQNVEEKSAVKYVKVGREMKQKVISYKDSARQALALEVANAARTKEIKLAQKKALIEKFNTDLQKLEDEIKALDAESAEKAEIAISGEKREIVLCDKYQTDTEFVFVESGEDPENEAAVIARSLRPAEDKEVAQEEK